MPKSMDRLAVSPQSLARKAGEAHETQAIESGWLSRGKRGVLRALGMALDADECGNAFDTLETRQMLAINLFSGGSTPGPVSPADDTAGQVTVIPEGFERAEWGAGTLIVRSGSYLVEFDDYIGKQEAESLARLAGERLGVEVLSARAYGLGRYVDLKVNGRITLSNVQSIRGEIPRLKTVEPDLLYQVSRLPNDPRFSDQYSLRNVGQLIPSEISPNSQLGTSGADIHVEKVWDISIGSRANIIAIIDTGIDLQHPDLIPNLWVNPGEIAGNGIDDDGNGFTDDVNGFDFAEFDGNPQDEDTGQHGTQVASAAGAAGNNGQGVAGVSWNVSLMALKIADRFGGLSTNAIVAAHDYATLMLQRGTNIVASNNSYGAFRPAFYDDEENQNGIGAERQAIVRFVNAGGTFVAAAGNSANDNDDPDARNFPASYNIPQVLAVAATDNNDALAGFSSFGVSTVDLAAPGVQILMAQLGGGYGYNDGTSFASPIVAGAVALLKSIKPNASAVEIREALISGSDPLPSLQGKVRSGGRINIENALRFLTASGPIVQSVVPGPVVTQVNPTTGQPYATVVVNFSKEISAASLSTGSGVLTGSGPDDIFGNGNDISVPITGVAVNAGNLRQVTFTLNLASFPGSRLPVDSYRLTLIANNIRDVNGNLLNGNNGAGVNEDYNFRVVASTGDNEPNDTLATATPVTFTSSGAASFSGVTLGNGLAGNLDVDLYRIDIPRGGQITVEVFAKRLINPSSLDSVARLFDASGTQVILNDNFFAQDSYIDFFVATGGVYYLGISGFGNSAYDPRVSGSGASQSTGTYNVSFRVQLSEDDTVLLNANDAFLPRRIPAAENATQGITTSSYVVLDSRQILDVNIRLDITHPVTGDLVISLIAPNNREITLVNRRGGVGDNFSQTVFDDEASLTIAGNGFAPFNNTYQPEQALGGFDGLFGAGRWTLRINDVSPQSAGTLNSWSLQFVFQNSVFGPFESNDTLVTARPLPGVAGTGAGTLNAFLGDGGFGALDRDIFRFLADGGSSLTARVASVGVNATSAPTLNSALRLLDSNGGEVKLSNPAGTLNSSIENYVFPSSGTFYLSISESNNTAYNPSLIGDGTGLPALSTGNYRLTVTLAPGVSDPALVLSGDPLSVGINTGANLGATSEAGTPTSLSFNGVDFLRPRPTSIGVGAFTGMVVGGFNWSNSGTFGQAVNELPFALTDSSDAFNNRVSANGVFRGLKIDRSFSYGISDSYVAIDVILTNTTQSTITGVGWMEGFNPDPGLSLNENNLQTANDIDPARKLATATYTNNQFRDGLTVGLAAPATDTRAKVTVLSGLTTIRDPQQLIDTNAIDPNGAPGDSQLVISYNVGDLGVGGTTRLRYFIFFGSSSVAVSSLANAVNAGTGTGHLTANPATPATEALQTGSVIPVNVPTLPFRVYYPEGFYGNNIFTFLPISNPHDQPNRVVVVARYEQGTRDQVVGELTIAPNSRSGLTLLTPELFAAGTALAGRPGANGVVQSYALEIRAQLPIAATFSHYDLNQAGGARVAIGESFTTRIDTEWSFGNVKKGVGQSDFLLFYNTTAATEKVTINFFPVGGGIVYTEVFQTRRQDGTRADGLEGFRRGGLSIKDIGFLPDGEYGVTVTSPVPIVASLSRFDATARTANGQVGAPGLGSTSAVIPEGQFSLNAQTEAISVLNANAASADITFTFTFTNGSAYRSLLTVAARSNLTLNVQDLPNFPTGTPYSVSYESTRPVTLSNNSPAFNDGVASAFSDRAYTLWGFGEGFRPGDNDVHPGVVEYLRIYNPEPAETVVEITIAYDGTPGSEVFRRTIPARRMAEFDMDQFITGDRRLRSSWFATTVKGASPVVAYMGHFDRAFPGGFGTLGTPMGISGLTNGT